MRTRMRRVLRQYVPVLYLVRWIDVPRVGAARILKLVRGGYHDPIGRGPARRHRGSVEPGAH